MLVCVVQVKQLLQAPNPAVSPVGTTEEWTRRHFAVQTTIATVFVEEDSSEDDWGAEDGDNAAPPEAQNLIKQKSESVKAIWGEDNGDDEDDGGWGEDNGDDEDDAMWGEDADNEGDEWDADTPDADAWDSQAEDFAEVAHTYPCPPEEDSRACSSEYSGIKAVVDVLDYATAAKRLVWLEREFQNKVAYIDEWPLERVRKLLRAHNYDFRSVRSVARAAIYLSSLHQISC